MLGFVLVAPKDVRVKRPETRGVRMDFFMIFCELMALAGWLGMMPAALDRIDKIDKI